MTDAVDKLFSALSTVRLIR